MHFEFDAAFWATIALFCFLGVVIYLKVPGMIGKALDGRIKAIEGELAEAERLLVEAHEQAEADGVLGGAVAAFRGAGAG